MCSLFFPVDLIALCLPIQQPNLPMDQPQIYMPAPSALPDELENTDQFASRHQKWTESGIIRTFIPIGYQKIGSVLCKKGVGRYETCQQAANRSFRWGVSEPGLLY